MRARLWRMRRALAALVVAGMATAAIVGFAHHFRSGSHHDGGLRAPVGVSGFAHVQPAGPSYTGG